MSAESPTPSMHVCEEAQARLWEVIHQIEDPTDYDQANADLDTLYSALLAAQDVLRRIAEGDPPEDSPTWLTGRSWRIELARRAVLDVTEGR